MRWRPGQGKCGPERRTTDPPHNPGARHDRHQSTRGDRRRQADVVRLPRRRRGRRHSQHRARRDGRPARLLPRDGRPRPAHPGGARRADVDRRALRSRVAQRPGRRGVRRLRPRDEDLLASARARDRHDRRDQPRVPARLLPDRPRDGPGRSLDPRGRPERRRPRLAPAQHRRPPRVRAVLPSGLPRQPRLLVAPRARRSSAQAAGRRQGRGRRLRPRRIDDPDGTGVPELDVRRLRLPPRVHRDCPPAGRGGRGRGTG